MKLILLSLSWTWLVLACGSKAEGGGGGEAADCPAFELTVDGQAVTGFTNKLAFTHKRSDERIHQVQWFNHDKATCADVTSKKGRVIPEGEVDIAAMAGGSGAFGKGVMMSSHSQLGVDVK